MIDTVALWSRRLVVAFAALLVVWAVIDPQTRAQFLSGPGIAQGALVAAIALGVVLTYRGSGVVNFSNSAVAMYIAYVYAVLRRDGDLFLPPLPNPLALIEGVLHKFQDRGSWTDLPDWPTRISFGPNMTFWPALVISLVVAGGLWRSYGSHIGLSLGFCVALALSVLQLLRTKSFVTGAEIVQQRGFFARRVTPLVSVKRGRIFPLVGAPNVGDIVLETVSGKVRLRSVSEPENILARLFSMRDALKENRVQ